MEDVIWVTLKDGRRIPIKPKMADGLKGKIKDIEKKIEEKGIEIEKVDTISISSPDSKTFTLTKENMQNVIDESVSKWEDNYARHYITKMKPDDFLKLTANDKVMKMLNEEKEPLDLDKLNKTTNVADMIYLSIDMETGEVTGHEGRHRMLALKEAGYDNVDVVIWPTNYNKYEAPEYKEFKITGQKEMGLEGNTVVLDKVIPVSKSNTEMLLNGNYWGDNKPVETKQSGIDKLVDKYKEAEFSLNDKGKACVKYNNNEINFLDTKEYKKLATDFADSLDDNEIKTIQDYVDCPGYSGDLNAYDPYSEKTFGTRYLYNTTNENFVISKNELNKWYMEIAEKYKKEFGNELNPFYPTHEQREWARKIIGKDAGYTRTEDFLKNVSWRIEEKIDADYLYYTKEEIDKASKVWDKIQEFEKEQYKYNWREPEYDKWLSKKKEYLLKADYGYLEAGIISKIDKEVVFNDRDYDYEKLLEEGKLEYINTKEMMDLKNISPYQTSNFTKNRETIQKVLNDYNDLFDKKGVELKHDTLVFRRGRESEEQIKNGFKKSGLISTSLNDSLPKKMPSGNWFGDRKEYTILPKGTKVLFSEKVIGRNDKYASENEDVYRGVRRQHEILLRPETEFKTITISKLIKNSDLGIKNPEEANTVLVALNSADTGAVEVGGV